MVGQTQTSMCNHSSLPQWSLNRPLLRDHPWTSILMEFRPPTAFTLHLNAPGKEQNQKLGTRFPLPTLLFVFTSAVWMTNETWTETDEHRAALHYTSQGQLKVATLLSSKQNYCQSKGGGSERLPVQGQREVSYMLMSICDGEKCLLQPVVIIHCHLLVRRQLYSSWIRKEHLKCDIFSSLGCVTCLLLFVSGLYVASELMTCHCEPLPAHNLVNLNCLIIILNVTFRLFFIRYIWADVIYCLEMSKKKANRNKMHQIRSRRENVKYRNKYLQYLQYTV